eukprot:jgi/Mesvir1/7954/Mv25293-RA.1
MHQERVDVEIRHVCQLHWVCIEFSHRISSPRGLPQRIKALGLVLPILAKFTAVLAQYRNRTSNRRAGHEPFPPPPPSRFSIQGCQLGDGTFLSSGLGWVAVTVTRLCGASSSGSDSSDSSESSSNPLGGPPCASSFGGSSSDSSPVCGTSNDERRN